MLLSYIFGLGVFKHDILSNNRRSKLHAVIDCLFFSLAWEYRSLPSTRSGFKRTNSEPSSIALQVEGLKQKGRANRSHGDLNSVDQKCNSEIPVQFSHKGSATNGDSGSTSSSTSSPPASPLPSAASVSTSTCLSAQEELDQFPGSHFPFSGLSM